MEIDADTTLPDVERTPTLGLKNEEDTDVMKMTRNDKKIFIFPNSTAASCFDLDKSQM